jgi:hypothetical protein
VKVVAEFFSIVPVLHMQKQAAINAHLHKMEALGKRIDSLIEKHKILMRYIEANEKVAMPIVREYMMLERELKEMRGDK